MPGGLPVVEQQITVAAEDYIAAIDRVLAATVGVTEDAGDGS